MVIGKNILNPFLDFPQPYNKIGDGPECPEVRILADLIRPYLTDSPIIEWDIVDDKYKKLQNEIPVGTITTKVQTHGKLMYFSFDNDKYAYCHLMLKGWWTDIYDDKYRLSITTKAGTIYFMSGDRLAKFQTITKEDLDKKLKKLGPDLMEEALNGDTLSEKEFMKIVKKHFRAKIGNFLMNQDYLAGIGNYLRSDVLNVAGINPHRKISSLEKDELRNLYNAIMSVLKEVYEKGGSIKYNKERGVGEIGYDFKVYDKKTDPSGNDVMKEKMGNRYVYWAPDGQD